MIGVTKIIKKVFVPHFKFRNLLKKPQNVGGLKKRAACKLGKLVDEQLFQISKGKLQEDQQIPETTALLQHLTNLDLSIFQSQVYVSCPKLHLCAYIDLILKNNTTQELIVAEIKTGCHYRLCCTKDGFIKYQEKDITDCMLHQHQLQALLGKTLFESQSKTPISSCLIYVNKTEIIQFNEKDFAVTLTPEAFESIQMLISKKRKRKSKK